MNPVKTPAQHAIIFITLLVCVFLSGFFNNPELTWFVIALFLLASLSVKRTGKEKSIIDRRIFFSVSDFHILAVAITSIAAGVIQNIAKVDSYELFWLAKNVTIYTRPTLA